MSKHRARVQLRRKRGAVNSETTGYGAALIDIYRRALQGGSDAYLTVNQEGEPERVAKLRQQAQERRIRRNAKHVRQAANEAISGNGHPHGQSNGGSVRPQRVGKIRGFARRVLREIAERSDRGSSGSDAGGEGRGATSATS